MDGKIEKAQLGAQGDASNWVWNAAVNTNQNYYQELEIANASNWVWNAAVNTLADFAQIGSDTFRLGSGIGCALFNDQASASDKAWAVASDVFRGAAIAGAGFAARAVAKGIGKAISKARALKSGQLGQGLKNVREITSGRLKGFRRGNTELPGGTKAAKKLFKQLTGKKPKGRFDRIVLKDGREVLFRGASKSGSSKIEVVNPKNRFLEKISFPE